MLPVAQLDPDRYETNLHLAVVCPDCTNYGTISGRGEEYRNVTRMLNPQFTCSQCSWGPTCVDDSPKQWRVYYAGRVGGTLLWAVNMEHIEVLIRYLETPVRRRKRVEFGWEFRHLMARLPMEATSGRHRNDVLSMYKKLKLTRPRGV